MHSLSPVPWYSPWEAGLFSLGLFALLYGAEAGNLALKLMATGGVYVGGGIAPKIVARLRDGRFMEGFLNKGRLAEALRAKIEAEHPRVGRDRGERLLACDKPSR